ncbi:ribonuclease P protein component [uncultured Methylobacterium sp.]|uniref:ribonuclease P protein component n=1 Tax=uncultured Methylobacterium sp. TaxID=157278 RepID=UPI0035CBFB04
MGQAVDAGAATIDLTTSAVKRLTRRADFLAVAGGRRFHTERMTAQGMLRAGTELQGLRVGLTVTKRVGHATERNRIKRRLRSVVIAATPNLPRLPADIVLVARRPTLHAPFDQLVQDLRRAVDAVTKPPSGDNSGKRPRRGDAPSRRGGKSGRLPEPGTSASGPGSLHRRAAVESPSMPPDIQPPREPV